MSKTSEDDSILWAGFHRGASESLIHACRDDDMRKVRAYAQEAIEGGERALEVARNERQRHASASEIEAARALLAMAREV